MTPSKPVRDVAPSSEASPRRPDPTLSDPSLGWVLAVELLTATLVWGGIGWLLDRWLGTEPWLMAIGFLGGNAAGIYLVWLKTNDPSTSTPTAGTTREGAPVAND